MKNKFLTVLFLICVFSLFAAKSPSTGELLEKGVDALNNKNYAKARRMFEKSEKMDETTKSTACLALTHYWEGNYSKALELLGKIGDERKGYPSVVLLEAKCNYYLGEYRQSFRLLKSLREQDSCDVDVNIYLGSLYEKSGSLSNAVKEYKIAEKKKDDPFQIYYRLAVCYSTLSAFSSSLEYYKKAIKLEPDFFPSYYDLGITYYRMGDYDKSISTGKKSLAFAKNGTDSLNAYYVMCLSATESKDTVSTDKYLKLATQVKTLSTTPDYGFSLFAEQMGKDDIALHFFNKLLQSENKKILKYTYEGLGYLYMRRKKYKEALRYYKILVNNFEIEDKSLKQIYVNMGACYKRDEEMEDGVKYTKKALKIDPEYCEALYNLACYYSLKKEKSKMLKYLKKAIKVNAEFVKDYAKSDEDFYEYRADKDFLKLIR